MDGVGGYLGERQQDELPQVHERVWYGERGGAQRDVVVEQDVDVDDAVVIRAVALRCAPHFSFDSLSCQQKLLGRKVGDELQSRVEEHILGVEAPWRALVEARKGENVSRPFSKQRRCRNQVLPFVADVRA